MLATAGSAFAVGALRPDTTPADETPSPWLRVAPRASSAQCPRLSRASTAQVRSPATTSFFTRPPWLRNRAMSAFSCLRVFGVHLEVAQVVDTAAKSTSSVTAPRRNGFLTPGMPEGRWSRKGRAVRPQSSGIATGACGVFKRVGTDLRITSEKPYVPEAVWAYRADPGGWRGVPAATRGTPRTLVETGPRTRFEMGPVLVEVRDSNRPARRSRTSSRAVRAER